MSSDWQSRTIPRTVSRHVPWRYGWIGCPKPIGIIGPAGADAGVDLVFRLVLERRWITQYSTTVSHQFILSYLLMQWLIAKRRRAISDVSPDPLEHIVDARPSRNETGAATSGIACNTAQLWHPRIVADGPPANMPRIGKIAMWSVDWCGFRPFKLDFR